MKFPITIIKNRVFVWYSGNWLNVHLEVQGLGGGFRGYYLFFKRLIQCFFGKHSYISVFRLKPNPHTVKECAYCRKVKNESDNVF
jgi:hypothetical protein